MLRHGINCRRIFFGLSSCRTLSRAAAVLNETNTADTATSVFVVTSFSICSTSFFCLSMAASVFAWSFSRYFGSAAASDLYLCSLETDASISRCARFTSRRKRRYSAFVLTMTTSEILSSEGTKKPFFLRLRTEPMLLRLPVIVCVSTRLIASAMAAESLRQRFRKNFEYARTAATPESGPPAPSDGGGSSITTE